MNINFSALKAGFVSIKTGSKNEVPVKDMDILDHLEKIAEIAHKYGIEKCLISGKKHLDYTAGKLGVSPLQAVLFSLLMERDPTETTTLREIAESVKSSKIRILKYTSECETLEKKRLIRCRRGNVDIGFWIPRKVRDTIIKHNEYRPEKNENLNIYKFFEVLEQLFDERGNDEWTYKTLSDELLDLIKQNMHLEFCKKIMSYNFDKDDLILLICFCHLSGNNNDDNINDHDLKFLYEEKSTFNEIKRGLSHGFHPLIANGLVSYNNNDGFFDTESWKLSDKAKKELLSELGINCKNYRKNLIHFESIKQKKMFFNSRETEAIQTLTSLLSEENYLKIQDRLDGKGMRKGFACLFSGPPGTGKTETAYQIARETKRNIMMIDISQTKSCWYGESEKKIKEIFDNYRNAVDNSATAPILLFNEADAVIGKRGEFSSHNKAIEESDNRIQNIILQEMENLSGILIATTNLTQNMDSAFERRFLYKITFDRPGVEGRNGIWKSMLPDLPEDRAAELSGKFDLSGGQIENIARKVEVGYILHGGDFDMDTLVQYCKDEIQNGFNTSKKIGFCNG